MHRFRQIPICSHDVYCCECYLYTFHYAPGDWRYMPHRYTRYVKNNRLAKCGYNNLLDRNEYSGNERVSMNTTMSLLTVLMYSLCVDTRNDLWVSMSISRRTKTKNLLMGSWKSWTGVSESDDMWTGMSGASFQLVWPCSTCTGKDIKHSIADIWWLVWGVFFIAIIERKNLMAEDKKWFDMFRVLFELVSAFGGIGLSLGFPSVRVEIFSRPP